MPAVSKDRSLLINSARHLRADEFQHLSSKIPLLCRWYVTITIKNYNFTVK